jgi:hypothetical protein
MEIIDVAAKKSEEKNQVAIKPFIWKIKQSPLIRVRRH